VHDRAALQFAQMVGETKGVEGLLEGVSWMRRIASHRIASHRIESKSMAHSNAIININTTHPVLVLPLHPILLNEHIQLIVLDRFPETTKPFGRAGKHHSIPTPTPGP
jgi:hypothetical protein